MINKLFEHLKSIVLLSSICILFFSCFLSVIVSAADQSKDGLAGLQPSAIKCIFYNESNSTVKSKYFEGCTNETSLLYVIQKFLIDIAPAVTTILIIFGGYEYFVDKEAKKTSALSTIIAAISGFVIITLAPVITEVVRKTFNDETKPFDTTAIKALLDQIINLLLNLSSIVAVAVIVLGGYAYFIQFFVNGGKQEGKINARDLLFGGVMGLIVTTLARPIVKFIQVTIGSDSNGKLTLNSDKLVDFIKNVLANFLIPLSSLVSLVFIIAAAYLWLTAGESEERVKNAKKFLTNALIGLVIVLLSTVIVQLIVFFVQPAINFIPGTSNSNTVFEGGNTPVTNTNQTPVVPTR
jgi:MFS family permease